MQPNEAIPLSDLSDRNLDAVISFELHIGKQVLSLPIAEQAHSFLHQTFGFTFIIYHS